MLMTFYAAYAALGFVLTLARPPPYANALDPGERADKGALAASGGRNVVGA